MIRNLTKNKKELDEEIERFRQEVLENIKEKREELLKEKEYEAEKLLQEVENKIRHKEDTSLFKTRRFYNPLLGVQILVDSALVTYYDYLRENRKNDLKLHLQKIKDINRNKHLYKKIKEDLKFLDVEKVVDFFMQNKSLKELRDIESKLIESLNKKRELVEKSVNKTRQKKKELLDKVMLEKEVLENITEKDKAAFAIINYLSMIEEDELNKKEIEQAFDDILSKEEIDRIIDRKEELFEKLEQIDEINYNLEINEYNYESAGSENYLVEKIVNLTKEIREIAELKDNVSQLQQRNNLDKAIRTAIIFDFNDSFTKDNVILAKDYLNHIFNTDLDLNDLKNVQNLNKKLEKGKLLDIDFNDFTFNKQNLKVLSKDRTKELDIELEK